MKETLLKPEDTVIILYDEECPLCKRFKEALNRLDTNQKIIFYALQDSTIYEKFPQLDPNECKETVHLITPQEQIITGSDISEYLIPILPAVAKFSWLLDSGMGKKAIQLFYNKVNHLKKSAFYFCHTCK